MDPDALAKPKGMTFSDAFLAIGREAEGRVYAFGSNALFQLGDGTSVTRREPGPVTSAAGRLGGKIATLIVAGNQVSTVLGNEY